jgi:hypothetical protein
MLFWILMAIALALLALNGAIILSRLPLTILLPAGAQVDECSADLADQLDGALDELGFEALAIVTFAPQPTRSSPRPHPVIKTLLVSGDRLAAALVSRSPEGSPTATIATVWQDGSYVVTRCPGRRFLSSAATRHAVGRSARSLDAAWGVHAAAVARQVPVWGPPMPNNTLQAAMDHLRLAGQTYKRTFLQGLALGFPFGVAAWVFIILAALNP